MCSHLLGGAGEGGLFASVNFHRVKFSKTNGVHPTSLHQEREIHLFTFCKHLSGSRLRLEAWDDKTTGEKKYKTEIICDNFFSRCSVQELERPASGLPCQLRGVVVPTGAIGAPGTATLHRKTLSLGPKGGVGLWCRCEVARVRQDSLRDSPHVVHVAHVAHVVDVSRAGTSRSC